ncbi:protein FATTY ACID EXPORT 1, chloroplastic isoform X2 [Sesamum indicum]|uniref:Protein FATTY ACID EXPORT 1, chloroplastic isoform X2 n=1 Tax=Sesamum indicum TaxID=4182 RepID=A0A8M8UXQ7_SESIN|nr:protein FATTY ACID EXPORT 1, chloroplastic isoform X2 [Sesamum indicum]
MSSAIAQLSCFSSVIYNRRLQLNCGSYSRTASFGRGRVSNVMSSDGRGSEVSNLADKTTPSYVEDSSKSHGSSTKADPLTEGFVIGESNGRIQEQVNSQPKRGAKIHDFCFGIPFGGLVLSGGLLGFILSRNPVTLSTGVLFGGALLALSTFSLKVWRQGKSSLPFILGQAVFDSSLFNRLMSMFLGLVHTLYGPSVEECSGLFTV